MQIYQDKLTGQLYNVQNGKIVYYSTVPAGAYIQQADLQATIANLSGANSSPSYTTPTYAPVWTNPAATPTPSAPTYDKPYTYTPPAGVWGSPVQFNENPETVQKRNAQIYAAAHNGDLSRATMNPDGTFSEAPLTPREQAVEYLKTQGYTNPDEGEIQGAMEALGFVQKPAPTPPPSTSGTSGNAAGSSSTTGTTGTGTSTTGLAPEFQAIYDSLDKYLSELEKRGQVLNPNIEITPAQAAEFLAKAQNEINPYFQGQIKMAKDSLLASLGYTKEELANTESDLERKYGTSLRTLGENAAETGFAQSGRRIFDENTLAQDTASTIGANRRQFANQAGNLARTFAQTYGTSELPSFNLGAAPQVASGESKFGRSLTESPLYQLSPDVYSGLIGSEEYKRRQAVSSRASELENAFRTTQGISQARTLML